MTYLLDVNALVALGVLQHEFHSHVSSWVATLRQQGGSQLATCSMTELGFVRVLAQAPQYNLPVPQAVDLLVRIKASKALPIKFIADGQDISRLPSWVKTPTQTTDGHLAQLASANGAILATLDKRIQGSYLIPTAS